MTDAFDALCAGRDGEPPRCDYCGVAHWPDEKHYLSEMSLERMIEVIAASGVKIYADD